MEITADGVSATAAVFAGATAVGAWITAMSAARASSRAAEAAEKAAEAAMQLTKIEERRLHSEFSPKVEIELSPLSYSDYRMDIVLIGPAGLDKLDLLRIFIRDDKVRTSPLSMDPEREAELRTVVFSPLMLKPEVDGADSTGRFVSAANFAKGVKRSFMLTLSKNPTWYSTQNWRSEFSGEPLRIMLDCSRKGVGAWAIPLEIDIPENPYKI